jgi:hypothetical protein
MRKGHGNRPSKRVTCTYVCRIPEKKNYEACLLLRRVLQPLNFLDAQNLLTHAFIFPKENPTDSYRNPKKETNDFLEIILTTTTTNLILQRSQTRENQQRWKYQIRRHRRALLSGSGVRVSRPTTCLTSARLGFGDARVLTVPSHPEPKNHPPVLIKTSFTFRELVFLVKVFRLFRLEWIFFGALLAMPTRILCSDSL